jgi:hypothetical protein
LRWGNDMLIASHAATDEGAPDGILKRHAN